MIDFRPTLFTIGILLAVLSIAMLVPAAVDAAFDDIDWQVFVTSALVTGFFGMGLFLTFNGSDFSGFGTREAFLLTFLTWTSIAAASSIPFLFSNLKLDATDAFFEAMSGITTTGATVVTDLDHVHRGILMWRSILQWLGGIGIVVTAIALLPLLQVGGMQLFRAESSDRSDKVMPRLRQVTTGIFAIYVAFTVLCAGLLWGAGFDFFDAVNHALTTVSTGGYSTRDSSVGGFNNVWAEIIIIVFMTLAGMTFTLHLRAAYGNPGALWRDDQVRWYLSILAGATILVTLWISLTKSIPILQALREAAFTVVSITTTTGYVTADYALWGSFAVAAIYFLTFVGGCTGSTAGAMKILRFQIIALVAREQLRRTLLPHRVASPKIQGRRLTDQVAISVLAFFFFYAITFAVLSVALSLFNLDFMTAITGAATAIGNVGPGLGPVIGPTGNFASLPDGAKWVLIIGMLLGRLEFVTIFVLLTASFWRD